MTSDAAIKKHVVVLGAGITGLQTALSLLETERYVVTIIATHLPGDFSKLYTSPWAGGDWRSASDEERVREWDAKTYKYWTSLTKMSDTKDTGIGRRDLLYYFGAEDGETEGGDGSGIWFKDLVRSFEVLPQGQQPQGSIFGFKMGTFTFSPELYMKYILGRVKELGGNVVRAHLPTESSFSVLISAAKSCVEEEGYAPMWTFVNCAGLSAESFLPKEEARKLFPIRGQTLLVKGEATHARTYASHPGQKDEVLYVIPRPGTGMTIFGGCKSKGNWNAEVDKDLSARIVAGIKNFKLAEELRTGAGGEYETVSEQVGLRPGREGGPRVEVDGKRENVWVVHSYGHAGAGYQNSVGSAEKVVELIDVLA